MIIPCTSCGSVTRAGAVLTWTRGCLAALVPVSSKSWEISCKLVNGGCLQCEVLCSYRQSAGIIFLKLPDIFQASVFPSRDEQMLLPESDFSFVILFNAIKQALKENKIK